MKEVVNVRLLKNIVNSSFLNENINGILGTVIFHLLVIILILASRLSSFEHQQEHTIFVEFENDVTEEEFREYTESLLAQNLLDDAGFARNIAVDVSADRPVPDQFKEMSSQEISDLDSRVNEILDEAARGIMPEPDQPEIKFETPVVEVTDNSEKKEPYTGPTTITYDLPGRTHLRVPVPVYKCPDGGTVQVNISVNRQGNVVKAEIDESPENYNETCIHQMALEAAIGSLFTKDTGGAPVQTGTITFNFQKQ